MARGTALSPAKSFYLSEAMTTKRKSSRQIPAPKERQVFKKPTLTHIHYHPEAGIVRAHVEQDTEVMGETQRRGKDVDIPIADLTSKIGSSLVSAFEALAKELSAAPYREA